MRDPDRSDDVAEVFDRYSERTVLPITECLIKMTRMSVGQHVFGWCMWFGNCDPASGDRR